MEKIDLLPLGSVVIPKGENRKIMIISRGIIITVGEEKKYVDYGACLYPEGIVNGQIIYLNHENIGTVEHKGYVNELEKSLNKKMCNWMENSEMQRSSLEEIKNAHN